MPQSGLISSPAKPLNACFSGMEFSPALLVRRPDGTWVAIGPELDGIARFISDIAIPNPRDRHGTPRRTLRQRRPHRQRPDHRRTRAAAAGNIRAHDRARAVMTQALLDADQQPLKWPETINLDNESNG